MTLDELMGLQIAEGVTVDDVLTVDFLASVLGNVLAAMLILALGFAIGGWIRGRLRQIGERHPSLDVTLFNFLGNLARYTILAVTAIFVLNRFGLETTSLVAALGAAGLAIGLALQGTLSNVASGIMLILFRPLKVGDFVAVAGEMGTVRDLNLNFIELASLGNTQIIRDTIMSDPRSKTDPEPFFQVNNLGDSSVDFLARVWVDAADYFAFQADMKRAVKEALDAGGIEIPFPYRTLVMAGGEAPRPPKDAEG